MKVSVIIPIYKVEQYLPDCLNSLLAQTYRDWEAILVDDGSPDKSGDICDEYAARDSRFRVIHKENGGVSSARNVGLYEANGEWIMFLDSDDELSPNTLSDCVKVQKRNQTKVIFFHAELIDESGNRKKDLFTCKDLDSYTGKLYTKHLLGGVASPVIWGKLYHKSVIGETLFPLNVRIGEDYLFLVNTFFDKDNKISIIKKNLYRYRFVPSSISHKKNRRLEKDKKIFRHYFSEFSRLVFDLYNGYYQSELYLCKAGAVLEKLQFQGIFKHLEREDISILEECFPHLPEYRQDRINQIRKIISLPTYIANVYLTFKDLSRLI